jgi:hypothetical protein
MAFRLKYVTANFGEIDIIAMFYKYCCCCVAEAVYGHLGWLVSSTHCACAIRPVGCEIAMLLVNIVVALP